MWLGFFLYIIFIFSSFSNPLANIFFFSLEKMSRTLWIFFFFLFSDFATHLITLRTVLLGRENWITLVLLRRFSDFLFKWRIFYCCEIHGHFPSSREVMKNVEIQRRDSREMWRIFVCFFLFLSTTFFFFFAARWEWEMKFHFALLYLWVFSFRFLFN